MKSHATATFKVKSWDEKPYNESPKMTRASVQYEYHGDVEGDALSESLMIYGEDASASYVTLERIVGTLAGKAGSFVLQGSGTYSSTAGEAKWTAFVVPVPQPGTCAACAVMRSFPPLILPRDRSRSTMSLSQLPVPS